MTPQGPLGKIRLGDRDGDLGVVDDGGEPPCADTVFLGRTIVGFLVVTLVSGALVSVVFVVTGVVLLEPLAGLVETGDSGSCLMVCGFGDEGADLAGTQIGAGLVDFGFSFLDRS